MEQANNHTSINIPEATANANLIAAAPTLFNMLKWCVNHDGECLADHPELLEVARAVIDGLEALTMAGAPGCR